MRVCDPTYKVEKLQHQGIQVLVSRVKSGDLSACTSRKIVRRLSCVVHFASLVPYLDNFFKEFNALFDGSIIHCLRNLRYKISMTSK